ncbi:hypothetical protein B296_00027293 [Ensete ventricosum]|uniref:Uncharacterized protein n=1 Tax=Ensete ventricosum TaxID=4639 RepID=A0A426YC58_ENSVE|nr:hypothetical protein B296_00027293 [Ensete ventricosum]
MPPKPSQSERVEYPSPKEWLIASLPYNTALFRPQHQGKPKLWDLVLSDHPRWVLSESACCSSSSSIFFFFFSGVASEMTVEEEIPEIVSFSYQ